MQLAIIRSSYPVRITTLGMSEGIGIIEECYMSQNQTTGDWAMVDYNEQVTNMDYTIEEDAQLPITEEAMIQFILTLDGVLTCEEQKYCHEVGPVLCRFFAGCLMRSAAQVKLVHRSRPLSQSMKIPLSLRTGDPGSHPSSFQILCARALVRAMNWNIYQVESISDTSMAESMKRTRLLYTLLGGLHLSVGRGKVDVAKVEEEKDMESSFEFVVDQNITDINEEYKKNNHVALTDTIFKNAYELLRLQQAFRIINSNFEVTKNIKNTVVRVYSACIFRAAARVIRIRRNCSLGEIIRRPVSVLLGDTGISPSLIHIRKARAVLRATQWGPLSWEDIVKCNPENAVYMTRCVHQLVRAIFLG